jgi:hypothetical protein
MKMETIEKQRFLDLLNDALLAHRLLKQSMADKAREEGQIHIAAQYYEDAQIATSLQAVFLDMGKGLSSEMHAILFQTVISLGDLRAEALKENHT